MLAASVPPSSYAGASSPRRRAVAFALAVTANLIILLLLLRQGVFVHRAPDEDRRAMTVQLLPDIKPGEQSRRAETKVRKPSGGASPHPAAPVAAPPPKPDAPPPPLNLIPLTSQEYAASDISKMPARAAVQGPGAGSGRGDDTGSSEGAGQGPGGEKLYNADWYVRPTHAEMATYLPPGTSPGWGEIECRTVANYRVEDCRELGDSPSGSGLARALRQAAWQFKIKPPRIGGKPLVGAWVRIHFDFDVIKERQPE